MGRQGTVWVGREKEWWSLMERGWGSRDWEERLGRVG